MCTTIEVVEGQRAAEQMTVMMMADMVLMMVVAVLPVSASPALTPKKS